jgi:hypothetical protein
LYIEPDQCLGFVVHYNHGLTVGASAYEQGGLNLRESTVQASGKEQQQKKSFHFFF